MTAVEAYWEKARPHLGQDAPLEPPPAWAFGDSSEMANELLELVLKGTKTATCDALWRFEADNEPIPQPGDLSIILDGTGAPRCVIETTGVKVAAMNEAQEADPQFAYDEGEGERSWDWWFAVHERFFGRTLPEIGREFDPTMPLVLERFRKLYPRD